MKRIKQILIWFSVVSLFLLNFSLRADPLDNWTSRSSGTTNGLLAITFGNGSFVAVGSYGTIFTSPEGVTWTSQSSGTTNGLWGASVGNNRFVTVGDSGSILTSPDGVTWTSRNSETSQLLRAITYGNGRFVAVGAVGTILTSPDGVTWTSRSSGTSQNNYGVTYGSGKFVAVGDSEIILTSADGVNWTTGVLDPGYAQILKAITYGNGGFVTVGRTVYGESYIPKGRIWTSPDGVTWTYRTGNTGSSIDILSSITYGNGSFVAVEDFRGYIRTSSDGVTWIRHSGTGQPLYGVVYGNGNFVAVGSQGGILQSSAPVVFPPAITTQPANQTVTASQNAVFTVVASGNPAPSYQWQRSTDGGANWSNLSNDGTHSGVTTAFLMVNNTSTGMSGYRFRAVASNGINPNATSASATLTVTYNPSDTTPPVVAISSPTAGQTFTTSPIPVTGTASDSGSPSSGVNLVEVRVNGGAWQTAILSLPNWSRSVSLSSGNNTIEVRSRDAAGNYSANASVVATYNPNMPPPRVDVAVKRVRWDTARGGLQVTYSYSGPIDPSTSLVLFWANGDSSAGIIGNPIYSTSIPARTAKTPVTRTVQVEGAALVNPPPDATHLIAIIDPEHLVVENQELNNEIAVVDVQITYSNPDRDESHVSTRSQRIVKNLLRQAGHANGVITSTYRSAADQARVMFENLVTGSSAKYGPYGQMVIDVYKINVVGHTKAWIKDHSEEIITAMTDKIIEIGPENVSHHAYDPAVLNVIDIGPVTSRFTFSAKQRFSCAALDGVENGSISAFYGPQNIPACKPPVKDPAFHLEIVP